MSENLTAVEQEKVVGKVVQLPCGYFKDGQIHKEAEIIPMTGLTRKAIARDDVRTNSAKVTDVILLQCLKRVGTLLGINNRLVGDLLLGDRDFLLLEIRRISMGDIINSATECEDCKNKIEVKFNIDEIKVYPLNEKECETLDGQRVFRIQSSSPPVNAAFRFPRGEDQYAILPLLQKNPVEANYRLYAACLVEWNGNKGPFAASFFESLPVSTLDVIDGEFTERLPGPDLSQEVSCPVCSSGIEMTFQGSDFLFRLPKRGQRS